MLKSRDIDIYNAISDNLSQNKELLFGLTRLLNTATPQE